MSNRNVPVPVRTDAKGRRTPVRQSQGAFACQTAPVRQGASGTIGGEAFGTWAPDSGAASQAYGANPAYGAPQYGQGSFEGQRPYGDQAPPINVYNTNNYYDGRPYGMGYYPYRNKWVALLLCFFLGIFGVHRFYVGKVGTGFLWLFTAGFGGIGIVIDFILILCNAFRDKARMPLVP